MVDYVHTTGAQLLRFTSGGKEASFFFFFTSLHEPVSAHRDRWPEGLLRRLLKFLSS